jgi:hypothetical protein
MKHTLTLLISSLLLSLLLTNCQSKKEPDWRYEIKGHVLHKGQWHEAIWYTDTIEIGDNYVSYRNSDGTEVETSRWWAKSAASGYPKYPC